MPSWQLSKYIETKLQITCFYLTFKKKKQVVWNKPLCLIFCMTFQGKYFSSNILQGVSKTFVLFVLHFKRNTHTHTHTHARTHARTQIYKFTNLPVDVIVRLPHPLSGYSQGQETFLAPSADKQTLNYDIETSNLTPPTLPINPIYIYIYIYR